MRSTPCAAGCGSRCRARAFRPRRRAAPPGQPSTRASGGTSVGASIATPMKTASAPTPSASSRCFVERRRRRAPNEHQRDGERRSSRARCSGPKRAKPRRRQQRALAHRRDRLHARRADAPAGARRCSVTNDSDAASDDDDRARREHRPGLRQVDPERRRRAAFRSFARPSPRKSPITDASTPITNASSTTDQ